MPALDDALQPVELVPSEQHYRPQLDEADELDPFYFLILLVEQLLLPLPG